MGNLPDKLSRKACMKVFDQITPCAWEKLFEREDRNGIASLREAGDFPKLAYYRTNDLIHWLIRNGYLTPAQAAGDVPRHNGHAVRTHSIA